MFEKWGFQCGDEIGAGAGPRYVGSQINGQASDVGGGRRIGGLGSAVADALVDAGLFNFRLHCLALSPEFNDVAGLEAALAHGDVACVLAEPARV